MLRTDLKRLTGRFETEAERRQTRMISKERAFEIILRGPYDHIRIWDRTMDPNTYVGKKVLDAVIARLHPREASLQIFTPRATLQAYTDHPYHTLINFARDQEPSKAFVRAAPVSMLMPDYDLILGYGDEGAQVFALEKGRVNGSLVAFPEIPENIEKIFGALARYAQDFAAPSSPAIGIPS